MIFLFCYLLRDVFADTDQKPILQENSEPTSIILHFCQTIMYSLSDEPMPVAFLKILLTNFAIYTIYKTVKCTNAKVLYFILALIIAYFSYLIASDLAWPNMIGDSTFGYGSRTISVAKNLAKTTCILCHEITILVMAYYGTYYIYRFLRSLVKSFTKR